MFSRKPKLETYYGDHYLLDGEASELADAIRDPEFTIPLICFHVELETIRSALGDYYKKVRYGDEQRFKGQTLPEVCHDCHTRLGDYHRGNCDMEECPDCHNQMLAHDCPGKDH